MTPIPERLLVLAATLDGTWMHSSHVAECPDLGPQCAREPKPTPYNHVLTNYAYGVTVDAQYGLAPWLSLAASLPIRAVTTRVRYTDLEGRPHEPDPGDVHHEDRTIAGLADPMLLAIAGKSFGPVGFAVRLGAMVPLGRTLDEDPFALGRRGIRHEHVQFGSGTVRPVVGSALGVDLGSFGLDGWFVGILSSASNAIGYRPGHRMIAGGRISSALGTTRGRFGLGGEVSHESTETWSGLRPDEGNLGRTDVTALLTGRWSLAARLSIFGVARVPVHVHAVGAQLSYPLLLQIGLATALPL